MSNFKFKYFKDLNKNYNLMIKNIFKNFITKLLHQRLGNCYFLIHVFIQNLLIIPFKIILINKASQRGRAFSINPLEGLNFLSTFLDFANRNPIASSQYG